MNIIKKLMGGAMLTLAILGVTVGTAAPVGALPYQCATSWSNSVWPVGSSQCFAGSGQHRAVVKFKSWASGSIYTRYGSWKYVPGTSNAYALGVWDYVQSVSYQRR